MTYQVDGCRGGDGRVLPERTLEVIYEGAPDIIALQGIRADEKEDQIGLLSQRLGMQWYGNRRSCANVFLSYFPLSGVQEFDLGGTGSCLRADCTLHGKRLHLFNLTLDFNPRLRFGQIQRLLGPDLLGHRSLACPTLILGDFGDLLWGAGNINLALMLHKVHRPFWAGTFPARFPLFNRDRAYLRGDLRILEASVLRSALARSASGHLPLILTAQVTDPRTLLSTNDLRPKRMEVAPG